MEPNDAGLGRRTRFLTMLMLFLVSTFNYVDRTIISILQVPIKQELGLSDTQIGALTGLAFALFYTTLSLPIARLADRANRRNIIVISLVVWSAMTALSGLARNYLMLVLFRIGVAAGEAGSVPASHSTIADYFPAERRATALAVWGLSLPVGLMAGYGISGILAQHFHWRTVFAIVGGAGIAIAPLVWLLAKEPQRGRYDPPAVKDGPAPASVLESLRALAGKRVLWMLMLAAGMHGFTQYSLMNWTVPFYVRIHGMSLSQVGLYMGVASGVGGAIGMFVGGVAADRMGQRDEKWRVWVVGLSILGMAIAVSGQLLVANTNTSLVLGFLGNILMIAYYGPIVAVVQSLVSPRERAFIGALLLLVFNIIGLGLGPFLTGALSDFLSAEFGEQSLRWALLCCLLASTFAGLVFLWIGPVYGREVRSLTGVASRAS